MTFQKTWTFVATLMSVLALSALNGKAWGDELKDRPAPTQRPIPTPTQSTEPGTGPTHVPPGHTVPQPTSVPTADPVPQPTPTIDQNQIDAAHALGFQDGMDGGTREGSVRGPAEGGEAGNADGYRDGFARCEREERQQAFDRGYQEGFNRGQYEGNQQGQAQGIANGQSKGFDDGKADGLSRCDRDSDAAATPLGRAQGIEQADQSDATQRGQADGAAAGDKDARQKALSEDYPRGHTDYRNERFAEPVQSDDSFPQRVANLLFGNEEQAQPASETAQASDQQDSNQGGIFKRLLNRLKAKLVKKSGIQNKMRADEDDRSGPHAQPDRRFYNPNRRFPTPEENNAYLNGYQDGYMQGFRAVYDRTFNDRYRDQFERGQNDGCRRARAGDYRQDFNRGDHDGHEEGYARAYKLAYDNAYQQAYADTFRRTSEDTYQANYQKLYAEHFEEARREAYASRVSQLYRAAFDQSHDATFRQVYPQYAAKEYQRGRADEAQDFAQRPVRLIDAEVTETIQNGVFEPGEALRLRVRLRNFANTALAGRDIKVQLQGLDSHMGLITIGEATLSRSLNPKSMTAVSEILEFRMNENAVNRTSSMRLNVTFQGRSGGDQVISVATRFLVDLQLASVPVLHEGMSSEINVRIKNQGSIATDRTLKVQLHAGPEIENLTPTIQVGALQPGEERILSFGAIARQGGNINLRLGFEATEVANRRVGLLDQMQQVPVVNDYTINLTGGASGLRNAGMGRAEYVLKNVNSGRLMRSLQLVVRIQANDGEGVFEVLGPNPQFLTPLIHGQDTKFVVPVLVKRGNSGGTIELEVQENGQTVVIHRAQF